METIADALESTPLSEERLGAVMAGRKLGFPVRYFPEIDSTNLLAWRLAGEGAPEGAAVVADAQLQGRGRLNRSWISPPGANVYVSLVLRPLIAPAAAPQLTLVAGVAVAELLSGWIPAGVRIKWPNDILIAGKKACGILTEMKSAAAAVDFIILGIGINVNMNREDFEPSLQETATSLKIAAGRPFDRLEVISALFSHLETWYRVFLSRGFPGVRETWLRHADILGRPIRATFKEEARTGVVTGIDADGTLIMKDTAGIIRRVLAGDIQLAKE
ncbi:MAG: biotin--[acetyl-CoA-carboxylase] ligase [Pseudomonadota bacterium]|nr:biotin--[acetyl-CoA-carboxylase] ligase [Pseudomonadota bacterium]